MSVYTFEGYDPSVITVSGGTLTLSPTFNPATDIVSISIDEAGGAGMYLSGDRIVDEQADDSTQYLFGTTDGIYSEDIFTLDNGTKVTSIEVEGTLIGYLIVGTPLEPGQAYTITLTENPGDSSSGALRYDEINQVLCLVGTTVVETEKGPRCVSELLVGDRLVTADSGLRAVRWIGRTDVTPEAQRDSIQIRPVRIAASALGKGLPKRGLMLSQQHRVLVRAPVVRRMFGVPEVLVAAKHLDALEGVELVSDCAPIQYFHVLCDAHELIFAEGVACETLFPGPQVMETVPPLVGKAIGAVLSENPQFFKASTSVRPMLNGRQGRELARRLAKNQTAARTAITLSFEADVAAVAH